MMDAPSPATDALHVFTAFGPLHVVTAGACTALLVALTWFAHGLRGKPAEPRVRAALAIFAIGYWVAYNTWWNWHGIDLRTGLPLQACDISGLLAPFALLTRSRPLRATLYFWAFGFATQAFIQPTLTVGPAYILFWAFWTAHTVILACALYDLAALGFRPNWGDYGFALLASLIWAAVVLPIDLALRADYGFIGNPPADLPVPPAVAALGPWPQRLVVIFILAAIGFALLLAPWLVVRRRGGRKPVGEHTTAAIVEKQPTA
jgi:hypothetical integral membrane protein (TIGR02206 family)